MSKLTYNECFVLNLILRSQDIGDGWRNVSGICVPLITDFSRQELFETKSDGSNFHVRLSDIGKIVCEYLL